MNSTLHLPIILQLVGVAVIIAEIIIPSGGILALLATGLFGYSLYLVFANISSAAGMVFIVADLLLIPVLVYFGIKFLAKSPVTLRAELSKEDGVISQDPDEDDYIGRRGSAVTDLRPSGVARFGDDRLDVVTQGEYIDKDSDLEVIEVHGNQIIVKQIDA